MNTADLKLWIFETETLRWMLGDAERVAASKINSAVAKEASAVVIVLIKEELRARS